MQHRFQRLLVAAAAVLFALPSCTSTPPGHDPGVIQGGRATAVDGLPLAWTDRGRGHVPIVFVHGWCCHQEFWSEQVDVFARDHRVIALDLGGHGLSGTERDVWSFEVLARDVLAVLDELAVERAVLVGHSMGGPVALETARLAPERVVGIVGVDTLNDADWEFDPDMAEMLDGMYRADFEGTMRMGAAMMAGEGMPEETAAFIVDEMATSPPSAALALWSRFPTYDEAAALSAVRCPIHCINADPGMTPTDVEGNRRYAPQYEATMMSDVGHFPMLERPEEFNELLRGVLDGML